MEAHDDLAAIRRLMEDSQQVVLDNGKHFILWGVITAVGLVATWLAATGVIGFSSAGMWILILTVGWVGSMVIGIREGRERRVRTLGTRLLTTLWVSCGITLTIVGVAGSLGAAVPVEALSGLMSVILGIGFATTAGVTGMAGLRYLAVLWWLGGAWMLFVPGVYTLLMLASMSIVLQVVPGLALYRRANGIAQPVP